MPFGTGKNRKYRQADCLLNKSACSEKKRGVTENYSGNIELIDSASLIRLMASDNMLEREI